MSQEVQTEEALLNDIGSSGLDSSLNEENIRKYIQKSTRNLETNPNINRKQISSEDESGGINEGITQTEDEVIKESEAQVYEDDTVFSREKKCERMQTWREGDENVFKVVVPRLTVKDIIKIRAGMKKLILDELLPIIKNAAPK